MAGGVSKTFGTLFTILGALALVLGLLAVAYGVVVLDDERDKALPSGDRADAALAAVGFGLASSGIGFVVLLAALPLLVWGMHRNHDANTGRALTEPGGALRAWGVTLVALGTVALLAGLLAAAFGGAVLDGETQRLFPNSDVAEAAAIFGTGGLAVAALGLVFLLVGVPFLVGANSRAKRAGAPPRALTTPRSPGMTGFALAGGAAVVVVTLMLLASGPGGTLLGATDARGDATRTTQTFDGRLQGGDAPLVGAVGNGNERGVHLMTPQAGSGVVEAILAWDDGTTAPELVLVLEAQGASGEWREIARAQGGSELAARSGAEVLSGDVRALVQFAPGSGGDVPYKLILNVAPTG